MKSFKPTTKSRRHMTVASRSEVTTSSPYKPLTFGKTKRAGRNAFGRVTVQHKGGGHKQLHRMVDFVYGKINIPYVVQTVEYDPNRSGLIGLVAYADGEKRYILVPKEVKAGDKLITSESAPIAAGNRSILKNIPIGTFVYNVEVKPHGGAKLGRSAGNYIEILAKDAGYVDIKMPSSEVRKVKDTAWASIGAVSNDEHRLVNYGKAGRSRWKGIRPTVRGTAMNPVDHPYGGGEGRQGRGTRRAKTRHGRPTGIGQKTRTPKKYSNYLIVRRRGKKGKKR